MDMWNWLNDCYREGDLTVDFMENVMSDEREALKLFQAYMDSITNTEWIEECQHEIASFYKYIMAKERFNS